MSYARNARQVDTEVRDCRFLRLPSEINVTVVTGSEKRRAPGASRAAFGSGDTHLAWTELL